MGWFEQKTVDEEEAPKEQKFIENYDELSRVFESTINKLQVHTDEAKEAIIPIIVELKGGQNEPGKIDDVRMMIKDSRLLRTTMGQSMLNILKSIEDLQAWQSRYSKHLEDFIDSLAHLCRSSFIIIDRMKNSIKQKDEEIEQLKSQMRNKALPPQLPPELIERMKNANQDEELTEPPENLKRVYDESKNLNMPETRKLQLIRLFEACITKEHYMALFNEKRSPGITMADKIFLRALNLKENKFCKSLRKK